MLLIRHPAGDQWQLHHFLVDSGADETMTPLRAFSGDEEELRRGEVVQGGGINRKPE
jgi:hypothetical protein